MYISEQYFINLIIAILLTTTLDLVYCDKGLLHGY